MSRICFIFKRMGIGGAELRTKELAARFPQHEFTFVTTSTAPGELDEELRENGHVVFPVGCSLLGVLRYMRFLKESRIDVVHSHIGLASGPMLLIAALSCVPRRIAHFRSDGVGGRSFASKRVGLWVSARLIEWLATDILGVSPGSLTHGWRSDWRTDMRCRVIPNLIDTRRLSVRAAGTPRVLFDRNRTQGIRLCSIGRAEPSKRRHLAMQVWDDLVVRRTVSLFLIGGLTVDDERHYLSRRTGNPTDSALEAFTYVANAASVLPSMNVLLLTSTREGLPGVVLEALAAGTPVVATDLPGVQWIAEHVEGVRRLRLDAPSALWADAVEDALTLDRARIAASFSKSIFGNDDVIRQFSEVWHDRRSQ